MVPTAVAISAELTAVHTMRILNLGTFFLRAEHAVTILGISAFRARHLLGFVLLRRSLFRRT